MIYYTNDDIKIRDIKDEDVVILFAWWIDQEINRYDPRPIPHNSSSLLKECKNYCRMFAHEVMNKNKRLNRYRYFIITNTEDRPIGFINLFGFDKEKNQAEMGIIIGDKTYWRKGIAYKSCQIVLEYLFTEGGFQRIHIETSEHNKPARQLFHKLGFKFCEDYVDHDYTWIVMDKKKQP